MGRLNFENFQDGKLRIEKVDFKNDNSEKFFSFSNLKRKKIFRNHLNKVCSTKYKYELILTSTREIYEKHIFVSSTTCLFNIL